MRILIFLYLVTLGSTAPTEVPNAVEADNPAVGQFHSQGESGSYSFGHWAPDQRRQESRDTEGNVQGSYSYTGPDGKDVQVYYQADKSGFRSVGSHHPLPVLTGFPYPVQELPHVEAARRKHLEIHALQTARIEALKKQAENEKLKDSHKTAYTVLGLDAPAELGVIAASGNIAGNVDQINTENEDLSVVINSDDISGKPHHLFYPNHIVDDETDAVLVDGSSDNDNIPKQSEAEKFSIHHSVQNPHSLYYGALHNIIKPEALSYKATVLGALPPSAVHDVQVSPYQSLHGLPHASLPVFLDFGTYAIIKP